MHPTDTNFVTNWIFRMLAKRKSITNVRFCNKRGQEGLLLPEGYYEGVKFDTPDGRTFWVRVTEVKQ